MDFSTYIFTKVDMDEYSKWLIKYFKREEKNLGNWLVKLMTVIKI